MFGSLSILAHNFSQASYYAPQVSSPLSSSPLPLSPLSPRDGNTPQPHRRTLPMSSPTPTKNRKERPYSQRVTRSNPLIHNRGDERETRRKLFLKRVREGSEDKRWEARGGEDEMMRTIWIAEEKRRAEKQAMEASYVSALQEEEDVDESLEGLLPPTTRNKDENMADDVAQQEEAEIEALLSMIDEADTSSHPQLFTRPETPYGSDDEEYDCIFLDVINKESTSDCKQKHSDDKSKAEEDMMDTT